MLHRNLFNCTFYTLPSLLLVRRLAQLYEETSHLSCSGHCSPDTLVQFQVADLLQTADHCNRLQQDCRELQLSYSFAAICIRWTVPPEGYHVLGRTVSVSVSMQNIPSIICRFRAKLEDDLSNTNDNTHFQLKLLINFY